MKIAIVTDAWFPQVNGVVRTLNTVREKLIEYGNDVLVIGPNDCVTIPCPTYPEIRLALTPNSRINSAFEEFQPEAIHIATEGPLGWAARAYCLRQGLRFTTSFHTRFPEYIYARTGLPPRWTYGIFRRFHAPASAVMVTTPSMERTLEAQGFEGLQRWTRGVDTKVFRPKSTHVLRSDLPVFMYVGRVAVEKNIEEFLTAQVQGLKVVVGDGPQLPYLKAKYPEAHFAGAQFGEALVEYYNAADVFVFPSKTDTFGLVMLEALACGTPVAAFPVEGPLDVIGDSPAGVLHQDLSVAMSSALKIDPQVCRDFALEHSWEASVGQFFSNLRHSGFTQRPEASHQVHA